MLRAVCLASAHPCFLGKAAGAAFSSPVSKFNTYTLFGSIKGKLKQEKKHRLRLGEFKINI